ncbi:MAG: hypothetical protein FWD35_00780 [Oscillospiraceae bacterium]|nr:hypothetical protein [Oscillospiraceae bacterium]
MKLKTTLLFVLCLSLTTLVACGAIENHLRDATGNREHLIDDDYAPYKFPDPPLPFEVQIVIEIDPDNPEHSNERLTFERDKIMSAYVIVNIHNVSETRHYNNGGRNSTGEYKRELRFERYADGKWHNIPLIHNKATPSMVSVWEPGESTEACRYPLDAYDCAFVRGRYRAVFDEWHTEFTIA